MTAEVRLVGDKELIEALRQYGEAAVAEARKAIVKTAIEVHGHAVRSIQGGPKTGRLYTRTPGQNLSRDHRASAPKQAPATDTGRLVSSLVWRMDGEDALVGSTIADPPYPKFLEFGTVRMKARPFLRPALDANAKNYIDRLKEIHRKAVP